MDLKQIGTHIQGLASLEATRAPVVSCYVDLEDARWRSGFDQQVERWQAAFPPGECRRWFDQAVVQIKSHLRRPTLVGTRGLALFARGGPGHFFFPLGFRLPVPFSFEVGCLPHIYRLVAMRDNFNRFAALVCTRDEIRILGVSMGTVVQQVCDRRMEAARRALCRRGERPSAGWRRRIVADAVAMLLPFMRQGGYRHLILAGEAEWLAAARQAMPRRLASRILDTVPACGSDALMDIVRAAAFSFAEHEEEESAAMVEWLCEGLGRDGWAVAGLEASWEVLSKGLAECLILDEHFCPEPGYECNVCGGRLPPGSPRSACLSCGSGLCVPYDEREAMVRAAVLGGAHIEIVNHSDALMRLGGVGCLLRPVPERYLYPVAA